MPQEGLGFMLSSKHGLAEYSRARGSPHQALRNSHSQSRVNASRPSSVTHGSAAGHGYSSGASQTSSSSSASSSLPSEAYRDVKQEPIAEAQEMPADVFGFLKNYSPHELAALYHRWGATNTLLDPAGMEKGSVLSCS